MRDYYNEGRQGAYILYGSFKNVGENIGIVTEDKPAASHWSAGFIARNPTCNHPSTMTSLPSTVGRSFPNHLLLSTNPKGSISREATRL
jgi:hypothetical protein